MEPRIFLIATAHEGYRQREFPAGATVIDPWRIIPSHTDARIRRLGENKPALISVLVPSRGRPEMFRRMVDSLYRNATHHRSIEVIAWLDLDDPAKSEYWRTVKHPVDFLSGERTLLSECWNRCAAAASGEIFMHCGDDITFDTPGWDQKVRNAFAASHDKILFVHGDDLGPHGKEFGTHGFVHRRWVETVGYFLPPLFSSDWNDVWLNEVANNLGRRVLLDFVTEHWHYTFGKSERDQTHADREERGERDGVVDLFKRTKRDRDRDTDKLRAVMA